MDNVVWLKEPEEHNYPSAGFYLNLLYNKKDVKGSVKKLRQAKVITFKARDIFRASGLPLLGISNQQVAKTRKKIASKVALSPILLLRDSRNGKVIVADGYHRLCAVYAHNEEELIPCKIIGR